MLLLYISNSNELGYNFSLTPKASLQDGLHNGLIVSKLNKIKILWFGNSTLLKTPPFLKEVQSLHTKNIKISNKYHVFFQTQIDGELHSIKNKTINTSLLEKSLNVIT